MELKGTVTLDAETMNSLREEIREEVLQEIKEKGLYFSEVEKYLRECDYNSYAKLLSVTLNEIVNNTDSESITWKEDKRRLQKLQLIKKLWEL